MKQFMIGTSVLAVLVASPALAQQTDAQNGDMNATGSQMEQEGANASNGQSGSANGNEVALLSSWSYDPVYQEGISVDRLINNIDVYGPNGDEIGGVENVVFSDEGEALSIIAEVGGFWDIGDTHVNIPWDEVEFQGNTNRITVPVTEADVDEYAAFPEVIMTDDAGDVGAVDDDLIAGPETFKATDLIGDYATLDDNTPYGYVNDVFVSRDGQLEAIVVDAAAYGTPGYYAYPYNNTYGTSPADPRLTMPYNAREIGTIEEFDYDRMLFGNT